MTKNGGRQWEPPQEKLLSCPKTPRKFRRSKKFWLSPFLAPPERIRVNLILLQHFSDTLPSVWNRPALLWVLLNGQILHRGKQEQRTGVWVCASHLMLWSCKAEGRSESLELDYFKDYF